MPNASLPYRRASCPSASQRRLISMARSSPSLARRSLAAGTPEGPPHGGPCRTPLCRTGGHPALRPHSVASFPWLGPRRPWLVARSPPAPLRGPRTAAHAERLTAVPAGILPFGLTASPHFHGSVLAVPGSSLARRRHP